MVKCMISYEGGLHCELKHENSGAGVSTDAPLDNHGRGESFSPTDLLASSVAACMSTIMGIFAESHQLDLAGMKMEITKHMSETLPRRVAKIDVDITVPLPEGCEYQQALIQCATSCPVMMSINPEIEVPITWHWVG